MTILALRCIVMDHRHRNLQHSLRRPSVSLARQQQPDGGFGNLYNTALVMQVGGAWTGVAGQMPRPLLLL